MKAKGLNILRVFSSLTFGIIVTSSVSACSTSNVSNITSIKYEYNESEGKVEGKTSARIGEVITISVTPNDGYDVYKINGEVDSSTSFEYTVKKSDNVITIEFKKVDTGSIVINNITVGILDEIEVKPAYYGEFSSYELDFSYDEKYADYFIIEKNSGDLQGFSFKVAGLLACSNVEITAKTKQNISTQFKINVKASTYNEVSGATNEGWFNDIEVDKITNLNSELKLGLDVSYVKEIYDNGGAYFSKDGVEEPVFKILKDSGVNSVRIKQFVDPYNYNLLDEDGNPTTYGGGINDSSTNLWIAKYASYYGLDICIDLHYSDFYADPSDQVMPKSWKNLSTSDEISSKIYDYTFESLNLYKENGIEISSVQIGNETTTGLIMSYPGEDYDHLTTSKPGYIENKTSLSSSLSGVYGSTNFVKYVNSGVEAAKKVFPEISTIVHIAKGFSGESFISSYYESLNSVNFDVIGLSSYIYYQGNPTNAKKLLTTLKSKFPNKKILLAETSYGFTDLSNSNASNSFYSTKSDGPRKCDGYVVSPSGQAKLVRDYIEALNSIGNSAFGLYYWGGDMIPVSGCGWGDSSTKSSWANQALFSYGGKALPSLEVFNLIK